MLAEHYGIRIDVDEARTPKGLKRVLDRLKGHPAEKPLSFQLLRSLKQATYDVVNIGHFGLASADYLHFTSPIRRYPDLIVHRLLKSRLAGQGKPAGGWKPPAVAPAPERTALQRMAAEASFAERQAMEVEREVIDLYRAFFLRDRVGDVFEGVISGVTGFGVFVVVDDPFVEGLVRIDALVGRLLQLRRGGLPAGRAALGAHVRARRRGEGRGPVGQRRPAQDRLRAGGADGARARQRPAGRSGDAAGSPTGGRDRKHEASAARAPGAARAAIAGAANRPGATGLRRSRRRRR